MFMIKSDNILFIEQNMPPKRDAAKSPAPFSSAVRHEKETICHNSIRKQ